MNTPKFKFAAGGSGGRIQKLECISETEKMVVVLHPKTTFMGCYQNRHLKQSDRDCYFDTWEEARDLLLFRANQKLTDAHHAVESALAKLENINGMKNPEASA